MLGILSAAFRREWLLIRRGQLPLLPGPLFMLLVITLFALALAPQPELLSAISPAVIWVAVILSALLAQQQPFADDHADRSLEQLLLSPHPLSLALIGKLAAWWLATCMPLILLAPLAGLLLKLPAPALPPLMAGLLLGSPFITLVTSFAAALTVCLKHNGLLLALLALPLLIPLLNFALGAVNAALYGGGYAAPLLFIAALSVFGLAALPWATAAAIRLSLSE